MPQIIVKLTLTLTLMIEWESNLLSQVLRKEFPVVCIQFTLQVQVVHNSLPNFSYCIQLFDNSKKLVYKFKIIRSKLRSHLCVTKVIGYVNNSNCIDSASRPQEGF